MLLFALFKGRGRFVRPLPFFGARDHFAVTLKKPKEFSDKSIVDRITHAALVAKFNKSFPVGFAYINVMPKKVGAAAA